MPIGVPSVHRRTGYRQALLAAVIAIESELERLGYFTLEGGQAGDPAAVGAEASPVRGVRRVR